MWPQNWWLATVLSAMGGREENADGSQSSSNTCLSLKHIRHNKLQTTICAPGAFLLWKLAPPFLLPAAGEVLLEACAGTPALQSKTVLG